MLIHHMTLSHLFPGVLRSKQYFVSGDEGPSINFRESYRPDPRMRCTPIRRIQVSNSRISIRGVLRSAVHVNSSAGKGIAETPANMLWMFALLVTVARYLPTPTTTHREVLPTYPTGDGGLLALNILLAWYLTLGGCVGGESFWTDDKAYV